MSSERAPSNDRDARDGGTCINRFATFDGCPLCGSALSAEHAHFRCTTCGWRDSCCDWNPIRSRVF